MTFSQIKTVALAAFVMLLPAAGYSGQSDSEAVAERFVRLYFVEDNLAEAAKLTSGDARKQIDGVLREIDEMKAKEPPADKPQVQVTLLETQQSGQDGMTYVYRVASDVEVHGMAPILVELSLRKEGGTWSVSKFVQDE
jgi:hypothetical protein